jgi:hypothetical protein
MSSTAISQVEWITVKVMLPSDRSNVSNCEKTWGNSPSFYLKFRGSYAIACVWTRSQYSAQHCSSCYLLANRGLRKGIDIEACFARRRVTS